VLSDQLSDYEGEGGHTTAHVDIRSSRSARDFGRASGMLHTEEVTGSNPVSPTIETLSEPGFDCASDSRPSVSNYRAAPDCPNSSSITVGPV
jgi:hypothetical protein